jgi:hypothetical protein
MNVTVAGPVIPTPEQWAKLEEMRPHFCCLRLESDYHFVWDIYGVPAFEKWGGDGPHHEAERLSGPTSREALGDAIDAAYEWFKKRKP